MDITLLLVRYLKTFLSETRRLYLGVDVKTHRRESLRAPVPAVRGSVQAAAREGDTEEPGGRQMEEGGRGRGGGGGSGEGGPATYPRGVVPPSGVV